MIGTMSRPNRRPGANERGYSRTWRKYASAYLARHRWCRYCTRLGRNTRAEVVDHVVPHRGDPGLFWDQTNHQPLCRTCHNSTKQSEERSGLRKGCDADGVPIDPRHHWRT